MTRPAILCPACAVFLPAGQVEWTARRAVCPRCGLELVLDGEVVPRKPVVGYPDRLFALPAESAETLTRNILVKREGATTRVQSPGWLGKYVEIFQVSPDRFVSRGFLMSHLSAPLDQVDGVVPTQVIRWETTEGTPVPESSWRVQLVQGSRRRWLLVLATWDEARRWSSALNAAIARARTPRSAYRG
ncbi:MAG: hypothetical protein EOO75_15845 [Myxococcales bacterium]|nr:MAG: hypothetical protein EOO75_15845 [Myxococcales bacterium]